MQINNLLLLYLCRASLSEQQQFLLIKKYVKPHSNILSITVVFFYVSMESDVVVGFYCYRKALLTFATYKMVTFNSAV